MEKTKNYYHVKFSSEKIKELIQKWSEMGPQNIDIDHNVRLIDFGDHSWRYDNDSEFFADFSKEFCFSKMEKTKYKDKSYYKFEFTAFPERTTSVSIKAPTKAEIEDIFYILDKNWEQFKLPEFQEEPEIKEPPVIFIGHGRSMQWRDLKDHLSDKHGYKIVAYESGARAGHTIRDILDDMLSKSSFAILIMTGEDELKDGTIVARPNVIHEIGLFQGRLGFSKAIVLLEEDTDEFSNLFGIQQIRFSKGKIKETYGDILATIKREFE
ncbi:MAG: nucleotide-binding protein [Bacteroidia bacterium]|nr:nucleotide-binding protein [Bacteroidia bacterium]